LEKGGIITNTYWDSLNRNWLNSPLFPNAQPALDAQIIIEKKKKLLLSLLEKIRNLEVNVVKELLIDLRSDLSIRLAEQQSLLESAKWEVEKNIQWTSELNQVSELQKIRLDKQIEQFEELQRVLVKV
jgi:hypothetical protein